MQAEKRRLSYQVDVFKVIPVILFIELFTPVHVTA